MVQVVENPFILVDGSSYLYRAYYAFPLLCNSVGEPTGAIYGVLNMLKSLLIKYQPTHVAVVFDAKGKTFRDKLFSSYKVNRPPMPDNLRSQISPLRDMIKAMGLLSVVIDGVEADDVIGTLAKTAERNGLNKILISTGDKDMTQLVSPQISLINTMSNTIFGPQEVQLKFGVPPSLIVDYLALTGDSSDNIPGVPGIGEKTARVLLQGIGGLTILYQNLDNVKILIFRGSKTMANKLKKYREVAFLSYQLAKIKTDVILNISYNSLKVKEPQIKSLILFFQRYEFNRWLSDVSNGKWLRNYKVAFVKRPSFIIPPSVTTEVFSKDSYQLINNMILLENWVSKIRISGIFAFDIETDNLNKMTASLTGLCFSVRLGEAAYLPFGCNYLDSSGQLDYTVVLVMMKSLLEDVSIKKIGQNLKFCYSILKRYDITLQGIAFDITLESYVLDSVASNHDINSLAARFLKHTVISFKEREGKGQNQLSFNQFSLGKAALYAAQDADVILRLHKKLWPYIEKTSVLKKLFEEIEMPLVPVLSRIERNGVLINKNILVIHSMELTQHLKVLKQKVYQLSKEPFNLSSTKQLRVILYDKQKLPILKKTPSGLPSTSEEVLTELAKNYLLPKLILKYRSLANLKSSYTDKLPKMINVFSGRVHTSYHQVITATGRLSSSDPNLQNIPVRSEEGRRIRQAFVAPSGSFIVSADYSQIEMRIMAHISQDPLLLYSFSSGQDVHCITASEIFGIPIKKVTQDQRRRAKIINFGLIYGISAFGLSRKLLVTKSEAQKYINLYFEKYPRVLEYMELIRRRAACYGYVTTLYGRRLYLPSIYSRNCFRKKSAERTAINAPIQGTAADIIKRAMIKIDHFLHKKLSSVRMIMQVHDELVFEVQRCIIESAKDQIRALMEGCGGTLNVPLRVKIGVGENWDQAH